MAHINLLPWRTERRKQREREFFMQLAASLVAAILVLMVWSFWMGQRVDNQNDRNAYLQGEIKQVDERITKIKDLEKVRERLLARKQIIEQLQANRSQMVHLFDELVKTIPASARLGGLKQTGDSLTLDGVAQSNASVAEYMRNIEASPWMGHADLRKTENTHGGDTRMPYNFGLDVALSRPKSDENGDAADDDQAPIVPAKTSAATPAAAGTAAAHPASPTIAEPAKPAAATSAPAGAKPTSTTANGGAKS
jgi:type IV pilus assembly protein PilN